MAEIPFLDGRSHFDVDLGGAVCESHNKGDGICQVPEQPSVFFRCHALLDLSTVS